MRSPENRNITPSRRLVAQLEAEGLEVPGSGSRDRRVPDASGRRNNSPGAGNSALHSPHPAGGPSRPVTLLTNHEAAAHGIMSPLMAAWKRNRANSGGGQSNNNMNNSSSGSGHSVATHLSGRDKENHHHQMQHASSQGGALLGKKKKLVSYDPNQTPIQIRRPAVRKPIVAKAAGAAAGSGSVVSGLQAIPLDSLELESGTKRRVKVTSNFCPTPTVRTACWN